MRNYWRILTRLWKLYLTIEGYVVHVDLVSQNKIAFKLMPDSIESLVKYHRDAHYVNISADNYGETVKELLVKKLHEELFRLSINSSANAALEALEEDGSGELVCGNSEEVKDKIMALFLPLFPSPSQIVGVVRQPGQARKKYAISRIDTYRYF